jgi:N-carbamoylputrescine amidase
MSTRAPFTVAIIQDGVESTASATLVATEQRIRDAAGKGAQVICLKELFNAPYFCKRLDASRFDLAEEVTGATVTRLQVVAKELAIVLVVPIYERQGPGVYRNSACVIDADGALLGTIARCTSRTIRSSRRSTTSLPAMSTAPVQPIRA